MIIAGLTGSIATGKSTVGQMFADHGVPVYEADQLVHQLYAGPEAANIDAAFPGTLQDGKIDRQKLGHYVIGNADNIKRLEKLVHPLIRQKFATIATDHRHDKTKLVIFDIPLLLEQGETPRQTYTLDKIIVTYCSDETQHQRALARPNMTEEKFQILRAKQMPQAEKCQLADFTLNTDQPLETTRSEVEHLIHLLTAQPKATK